MSNRFPVWVEFREYEDPWDAEYDYSVTFYKGPNADSGSYGEIHLEKDKLRKIRYRVEAGDNPLFVVNQLTLEVEEKKSIDYLPGAIFQTRKEAEYELSRYVEDQISKEIRNRDQAASRLEKLKEYAANKKD